MLSMIGRANFLFALSVVLVLLACKSESSESKSESSESNEDVTRENPEEDGGWYRPGVNITWQWQLLGELNLEYEVGLYDIDLFDTSAETIRALQDSGIKVICYFSAGSWEDWRTDAGDFPEGALGSLLDGWPDEKWLDIRSEDLKELMEQRLDLAAEKGCDGVEPDNMDGYQNESGFDLTGDDQIAYNIFIADSAHERGLSVGLKNDLAQIEELVSYYDFSVNEQCFEYDECDLLMPFIDAGKPVLNAEYEDILVENAEEREKVCVEARLKQFSTLILPLDLDDAFRFDCIQ